MGETEVSWNEFWTFFSQTMSEGRTDPGIIYANNAKEPDAISGPTPPFGNPDQGWGSGDRPALQCRTMQRKPTVSGSLK